MLRKRWPKRSLNVSRQGCKSIELLIAFGLAQEAAPSRGFASASGQWNLSSDLEGHKSIPLPLSADKVVSKEVDLKDGAGKRAKKIASLARDTKVSTVESSAAADKNWVEVTVTSGRHAGMVGSIAASQLADPKMDLISRKKSSKRSDSTIEGMG